MTNMSSILSSHNSKILAEHKKEYECNCRDKDESPLENKSLNILQVIYEAHVITWNNSRKFYIGLSNTPFKELYSNHKSYFRNTRYKKSTFLLKYIWSLQERGLEFTIYWKILSHVR